MLTREKQLSYALTSDPIIGDEACQNRAVYLAYLAQKIRRDKALNNLEIEFLDTAYTLSQILVSERDDRCGLVKNYRMPNANKLRMFPAGVGSSNNQKEKYIAESKSKISRAALEFMRVKAVKMQFDDPILNINQDMAALQVNMITSRVAVPAFPFYLAMKMTLNIINRRGLDIIAVVKCINGDINKLIECRKILYQKTGSKYTPREMPNEMNELGELEDKKEAINIEFVEVFSQDKLPPSMEEYYLSFKRQDILKKVMIYAGNHSQFPGAASKNIPEPLMFFQDNRVNPEAVSDFDIDRCSITEYEAYKRKALSAGIERGKKYIDHISVTGYRPF